MDTNPTLAFEDRGTVLLIVAVVALSAATVVAFAGGVTAQVDSSERTLNATEVEPGDTVEVTIEATLASGGDRVSISDDFSPEFADVSVNNILLDGSLVLPVANVADNSFIEVALEEDFQSGDTITVVYTATVPEDASNGQTYTFDGESAIDDTSPVSHSGDSELLAGTPDISVTDYSVDNTTVGPGETVTVTANVENTGAIAGEKNVTFVTDGTDAENKTVSLGAGESTSVEFTTSFSDTGDHTVTVDDLSPTTISVVTADVSVTDYSLSSTQLGPGEELTVTATVENTGGQDGQTDVTLVTDGTDAETKTVSVGAGNTTTVQFTTSFAETGEYDVTVNDLSPTTVSVVQADLSVTDYSVDNTNPDPGETITITANLTNGGSSSGEIDVTLVTDGSDETTQTVTVPAGGSDTVTFTTSFADAGDHTVTVNDLEPTAIQVGSAEVSVTGYDLSATEVEPGETLTVTATVENTGELAGETDVTLFTGEDVPSLTAEEQTTKTVSVGPGNSTTVEFTTSFAEVGEYPVTVNDLEPTTVTVADIGVTDYSVDKTEVEPGETLTVTATVENLKSTTDSLDLELLSNGEVQETQTVSVGAGNTTTVELTTSFSDIGEYDVTVNDLEPTTVTVADIVVTDYSLNKTEAEPGEPIGVEATVENTKSTSDSLEVVLSTGETTTATESITLDGGESGTVQFATSYEEFGDYQLSVNDLEPTTVTVGEANLSVTGITLSEEQVLVGAPVMISATVTNDGSITGTLEVTVFANGEEVASDSISVGPGESENVAQEVAFDSVGVVELSVNDGPPKQLTVFDFEEDDDSEAADDEPTPTSTEAPADEPDDEEPTPTDEPDDEEPTPTDEPDDEPEDEPDEESTPTDEPDDETDETPPADADDQFGFGFVAALAALLAALALLATRRE